MPPPPRYGRSPRLYRERRPARPGHHPREGCPQGETPGSRRPDRDRMQGSACRRRRAVSAHRQASLQRLHRCRDGLGGVAGHDASRRHRAQPGQLALGELARGGDAGFAQLVQAAPRPAPARPGGSRRSASTAGRRAGRRARAAPAPRRAGRRPAWRRSAAAMRACSQARDSRFQRDQRPGRAAARCAACRVLVPGRQRLPVSRQTSSARWMRCASAGARRAAVAGSTRASSACSAGQPRAAASASMRWRGAPRRPAGMRVQALAQRLEIQHGAAHQQRQVPALRDLVDQARARRRRSAPRSRPRRGRGCRSGGAAPRRARRRWAWRCRCPCRGRPAPSRR